MLKGFALFTAALPVLIAMFAEIKKPKELGTPRLAETQDKGPFTASDSAFEIVKFKGSERVTLEGARTRGFDPKSRPVVIFIHGFPDNFHTFSNQMREMHAQGYHMISPALRGYGGNPVSGYYGVDAAVDDFVSIMESEGIVECHVVGHDWGAVVAQGLARKKPEAVLTLSLLAVPNAAHFLYGAVLHPVQLLNSWYFFFFQLPYFPERWLDVGGSGYGVVWLWNAWGPERPYAKSRLDSVISTLASPGALGGALGWYRYNILPSILPGAHLISSTGARVHPMLKPPIKVPTVGIVGRDDNCIDARNFHTLMRDEDFEKGYRVTELSRAGHFLQHDRPADITALLVAFMQRGHAGYDDVAGSLA